MTLPDLTSVDLGPLWLTLQLAGMTTLLLLLIGTPLAWWLAHTRTRFKPVIEALTALPLVLPPTVLGFYLLILFSPNSGFGGFWLRVTGETLTFSFTGLVLASMLYSLPFTVQPLQAAFEAKRGFLTAAVLSFAHTMGEFGVVLMVGGNIPGKTRVISIAIYEQVETIRYAEAHVLSAILLVFSFSVLLLVYGLNRRAPGRAGR